MNTPRAICLIGAECTGKTTLTQALASHFNGLVVDEYLRRFCVDHQRTPNRNEQAHILATQTANEAQMLALARDQGHRLVFCDTAPLMTAIYSEFIFADHALYPTATVQHARYALTLHLLPDIPWVADGLRDGAHARAPVTALIEQELARIGAPCVRIGGAGKARLHAAITAVATLLGEPPELA